MTTKQQLVTAVLLALLLGIVGSLAMDDEQKAEAHYCAMVADGLWPDYRAGEVDCDAN
jgi:hypothetical protein